MIVKPLELSCVKFEIVQLRLRSVQETLSIEFIPNAMVIPKVKP